MGIKDLWSILNSHAERKPLCDLEGKLLAVDLAGWVCENQNVVDYNIQPRLYLRNLYFRIKFLLQNDVIPVFVKEGDAPSLKYKVMAARNEIQFRGAKPRENRAPTQIDSVQTQNPRNTRFRFNQVLRKCEELINSMGLECVKGPGEAEAYCAYLNKRGFVDGILSQDSDCFAYGARKVYRNFSISQQGNSAAQGGSVDEYDMDKIQKSTGIGQNKVIVLALLTGCDYGPGVDGVGRDSVLKLFNEYSEADILDRVKSWRSLNDYYTELEMKVENKLICVNCGHFGRLQQHTKRGCSICKMNLGCDSSIWKEQRLTIRTELFIRRKALADPEFPSAKIFNEFFQKPPEIHNLILKWNQPRLINFVKTVSQQLQWDELYSFRTMFPLLTRWLFIHATAEYPVFKSLRPDYIKKKRAPKGVKCYEVVWDKSCRFFADLIPREQIDNFLADGSNQIETLYSTIEPEIYVEKIFPELVETYNASKVKPKKCKAKIKLRSNILIQLGTNSPVKRAKKTRKAMDPEQIQITNFIRKRQKIDSFLNVTPINLSRLSLNDDETSMVSDEFNISQVITNLINRTPKKIYFKGKHLIFPKTLGTSSETIVDVVDKAEVTSSSTPILKTDIKSKIAPNKNILKKSILSELNMSLNEFSDDFDMFN